MFVDVHATQEGDQVVSRVQRDELVATGQSQILTRRYVAIHLINHSDFLIAQRPIGAQVVEKQSQRFLVTLGSGRDYAGYHVRIARQIVQRHAESLLSRIYLGQQATEVLVLGAQIATTSVDHVAERTKNKG